MKHFNFYFACLLFAFLLSCSDAEQPPLNNSTGEEFIDPNQWNVPQDEVFDGGPGKDGIPSIDDPQFSLQDEFDTRSSYFDQLVVGIVYNGQARAYPHPILDWHEIVNDKIGDLSVAITYCPLTGTGIGWNREVNSTVTEFGVSGLLYDSNLMPYDRATNSTWSQQRLDCVNGKRIGTQIDVVPVVETTLNTWLKAYPDSEILNEDTGFNRDYGRYPYGDYRTNNNRLLFPISNDDTRFPEKERVLGVFVDSQVVARNTQKNFIVAFQNTDKQSFEAAQNFPSVLKDENGNEYDITGQRVGSDGSLTGNLPQMKSFIGYWLGSKRNEFRKSTTRFWVEMGTRKYSRL